MNVVTASAGRTAMQAAHLVLTAQHYLSFAAGMEVVTVAAASASKTSAGLAAAWPSRLQTAHRSVMYAPSGTDSGHPAPLTVQELCTVVGARSCALAMGNVPPEFTVAVSAAAKRVLAVRTAVPLAHNRQATDPFAAATARAFLSPHSVRVLPTTVESRARRGAHMHRAGRCATDMGCATKVTWAVAYASAPQDMGAPTAAASALAIPTAAHHATHTALAAPMGVHVLATKTASVATGAARRVMHANWVGPARPAVIHARWVPTAPSALAMERAATCGVSAMHPLTLDSGTETCVVYVRVATTVQNAQQSVQGGHAALATAMEPATMAWPAVAHVHATPHRIKAIGPVKAVARVGQVTSAPAARRCAPIAVLTGIA